MSLHPQDVLLTTLIVGDVSREASTAVRLHREVQGARTAVLLAAGARDPAVADHKDVATANDGRARRWQQVRSLLVLGTLGDCRVGRKGDPHIPYCRLY